MNILFVLPVLSDSYYRKRIEKISELGVHCSVTGFERDHYKGKPWSIQTESLGTVEHGNYTGRIGTLLRSVLKIRKAAKSHDVIYAFNLDILFISWLGTLFQSQKAKFVYDVADIRTILVQKGIVPTFLRALERFLLKRVSVVVVASPAYIDGYFKGFQNTDQNYFVIENKVDKHLQTYQTEPVPSPKKKDFMTIGYFGMLRCEHSLRFLKQLVKNSNGSIRLLLRGVFLQTEYFEKEFRNLEYAHYEGTFVYPDDLPGMFEPVDLVWGVHIQTETNREWSILNRFYQACYFKRPLIVQAGTQNAKMVQKFGIGLEVDLTKPAEAMNNIRSVGYSQIENWYKNMHRMPEHVYIFTDEHEKLIEMLSSPA